MRYKSLALFFIGGTSSFAYFHPRENPFNVFNTNNMEEKTGKPFLKPALIYGAILGFVGIVLSLVFYFLGLTFKGWTQWLSFAVGIAVLTYCLIAYRNEYMGGYASYGRLFLMALAIGFVAGILSAAFTYLLYTVIDPELIEKTKIFAQERIMNNSRIPESMHDDLFERIEKSTSIPRLVRGAIISQIILNGIFGLIIAAFVRKEEPSADNVG